MGENNTENKCNNSKENNNDYSYYFPIFMGIGLIFGTLLNQIPIGLCLGVTIGIILDYEKGKKNK